jgi:hypothetical protein
MATETLLDAAAARKLLKYNLATGSLTWLPRPPELFPNGTRPAEWQSNLWNARMAWTQAGSVQGEDYLVVMINNVTYQAHRVAWLIVTGAWPLGQLDHENGDRLDNRFLNLRDSTPSQNRLNAKRRRDNTSGFKGVSYNKIYGRWISYINVDRKRHWLGHFDTPEAAHAAYCAKAAELAGEFFNPG